MVKPVGKHTMLSVDAPVCRNTYSLFFFEEREILGPMLEESNNSNISNTRV